MKWCVVATFSGSRKWAGGFLLVRGNNEAGSLMACRECIASHGFSGWAKIAKD